MKIVKLRRTFKEGFSNFTRNGWLSVATISILSISLYIIGLTTLFAMGANALLTSVKENVTINVYFNPDVSEARILEVKGELEGKYTEIKSVEYVSKEKAMEILLNLAPDMKKAVEVAGENPLYASLEIRANDANQYALIAESLSNSSYGEEINNINYERNKTRFADINRFTVLTQRIGLTVGGIFILLAVLITFNAVRVTIYAHRQEFEVMRLVGASNLYVEMPFLFEGVLYGVFASLTGIVLLSLTYWYVWVTDRSLTAQVHLTLDNFAVVFALLIALGIVLGVVSSWFAIRRYLKK
ncbi:ABC transporter permease [Patescibacteria group bacterium]|nr:MAG: ABC transporter permease [Patescibacteria group bacterium]